jgi:hypothetical protein
MRTKSLFAAAAILATGLASSMAQSNVYSLNVVGYVNKAFSAGASAYYLVSNPLNGTNNSLSTIIPNPPVGTFVAYWDTAAQDFDPSSPTYFGGVTGWSPSGTVPPGKAFFISPTANFTNTFVGEVLQGSVTNPVPIAGGSAYVAVGSAIPIGGYMTNLLSGYNVAVGDFVAFWDVPSQDLSPTSPTFFGGITGWSPDYNAAVGEGFFLVRGGGATTWVRNFTVQ